VQGKYTQFDVDPADFAVYDQAFTGAPNELDQTGGRFTPIYASKVPDHRGLTLTSTITVQIKDTDILLSRTGPGLSMKLQAKDCANGGIFQMAPSTTTSPTSAPARSVPRVRVHRSADRAGRPGLRPGHPEGQHRQRPVARLRGAGLLPGGHARAPGRLRPGLHQQPRPLGDQGPLRGDVDLGRRKAAAGSAW
jgi:hypothetical protein